MKGGKTNLKQPLSETVRGFLNDDNNNLLSIIIYFQLLLKTLSCIYIYVRPTTHICDTSI